MSSYIVLTVEEAIKVVEAAGYKVGTDFINVSMDQWTHSTDEEFCKAVRFLVVEHKFSLAE